ncbi:hypothetical protein P3TCK_12091, partial [Photobacterium profundum 3TCK]
ANKNFDFTTKKHDKIDIESKRYQFV